MRNWTVPPLVALLAIMAALAPLRGADDPGDVFMQGYQSFKTAERQEAAGRLDDALQKYRFCLSVMQQIQKDAPGYEPVVVDFRLKKSREGIARVQSLRNPSPATPPDAVAPAPETIPDVPRPTPKSSPSRVPTLSGLDLPTTYRIPTAGNGDQSPPPAPASPPPSPLFESPERTIDRGVVQGLTDQIRQLQLRVGADRRVIEELQGKLLTSTAREQSALTAMDRWRAENVETKAQLAQTQQSLGDAQQTNDQLTAEKNTDAKTIAGLQSDLEDTRADLEVANDYNDQLFAKLDRAAKFIDASEKIRVQLLAERKELSGRAGGKGSAFKKLEDERDQATAKVETLQKRFEKSDDFAEQNKELSAKLTAAELKLAAAAKSREERKKIEDGLRDQLASVNKTLATTKDQLSAGSRRITDLEKQLAETSSATVNATGAMAAENALLKSLVARQINEQARRQQARRLVEEEMEKLQIRSTAMVDKLNALGEAETELTPKEKRLFDQPVAGAGNNVDFSLSITKKEPTSDLPKALQTRAKEANELSNKNRFAEARAIYSEIAKQVPQSYIAQINLGITERQLGDNAAAIAAFKRALEIRTADAYALTNLGKTELNNGELAAAVETLRKAVNADSGSYYGHYLLATALNQNGDHDEALREVSRAMQLNAAYPPAAQLKAELEVSAAKTTSPASKTTPSR